MHNWQNYRVETLLKILLKTLFKTLFKTVTLVFFWGTLLSVHAFAQLEGGSFFPLSPQLEADTSDIQPLDTSSGVSKNSLAGKIFSIETSLNLITKRLEQMPIAGNLPLFQDQSQQELLERLTMIEGQLQGLSQANGLSGGDNGGALGKSGIADLRLWLGQIEEVMRMLNGQIDDISFRLIKLGERFEQIAADTEFRFQELEVVARKGDLSSYKKGATGSNRASKPQVLGTIRVGQSAKINQLSEDDAPTLVGEARLLQDNQAAADPLGVYDEALQKLRMGAYEEAQEKLTYFLKNYKTHNLAGNAQYWLGETYYVRRDYKSAANAFLSGYTTYESSPKAPDSLLKLGMTLLVMGEKKTGCDAFAELASRFSDASQSVIQRAEIERQRAGCL